MSDSLSKATRKYLTPSGQGLYIVNTGEWRYQRPVSDPGKCKKCSNCWLHCPTGSKHETGTHFETDLIYCKGCGICARECLAGALTMVPEGSESR